MSTRYVWGKYDTVMDNHMTSTTLFDQYYAGDLNSYTTVGYAASSRTIDYNAGTVKLSGSIVRVSYGSYVDAVAYPYFAFSQDSVTRYAQQGGHASGTAYWFGTASSNKRAGVILTSSKSSTTPISFSSYSYSPEKGSYLNDVSSASGTAYPNNDISGKNWYVYKGSDSVDPAGLSLPEELRPGEEITVTLTPGSGKKYGGVVSYLYQYSLNNLFWEDAGTTGETSLRYKVPANAKSLQFRARAQDDMGFTSATYITSKSVKVNRLNVWVGVNGKARKGVELYVGVNGKARRAVAAYVGVNGKARRFM
mgnify:CR=1 FL=1